MTRRNAIISATYAIFFLVAFSWRAAGGPPTLTVMEIEGIARAEAQRRGIDISKVSVRWDSENSVWKGYVGEEAASDIEKEYSTCGYWAVHLRWTREVGPLSKSHQPGVVVLRLDEGGLFVLIDRCTGAVIDAVNGP